MFLYCSSRSLSLPWLYKLCNASSRQFRLFSTVFCQLPLAITIVMLLRQSRHHTYDIIWYVIHNHDSNTDIISIIMIMEMIRRLESLYGAIKHQYSGICSWCAFESSETKGKERKRKEREGKEGPSSWQISRHLGKWCALLWYLDEEQRSAAMRSYAEGRVGLQAALNVLAARLSAIPPCGSHRILSGAWQQQQPSWSSIGGSRRREAAADFPFPARCSGAAQADQRAPAAACRPRRCTFLPVDRKIFLRGSRFFHRNHKNKIMKFREITERMNVIVERSYNLTK